VERGSFCARSVGVVASDRKAKAAKATGRNFLNKMDLS